jgi:hypothetical protein
MSTLSAERCVAGRRDSARVTEAEIAELRRKVSGRQLSGVPALARRTTKTRTRRGHGRNSWPALTPHQCISRPAALTAHGPRGIIA